MIAVPIALAAPCQIVVPLGFDIPLVTVDPLSSKTSVKGDMVKLTVAQDLSIDGKLVIAKGTSATGQIADSQGRGGMGVSGRLALRPLYLEIGGSTVRLTGRSEKKGPLPGGTALGIVALSSGIMFSGSTAKIPAGSLLAAETAKQATVTIPC